MTEAKRLQNELLQLFQDELFLEVGDIEMDLFEDGLLDSLGFVLLLARLESLYGVEVPLDDLDPERFRTIEKIAAYVQGATVG